MELSKFTVLLNQTTLATLFFVIWLFDCQEKYSSFYNVVCVKVLCIEEQTNKMELKAFYQAGSRVGVMWWAPATELRIQMQVNYKNDQAGNGQQGQTDTYRESRVMGKE